MAILPLMNSSLVSARWFSVATVPPSRRLLLAFLLPFSLMIASCSPDLGLRQYASAVGPDLYSNQTIRNTALLDAYSNSLCQQAGLLDTSGHCSIQKTEGWKTFVDMGLYDIDQRCDAFLDSLYYKDKSQDAVLAQISGTRSLATSVLHVAAASNVAIQIVAAAFDFGENSFRNVNTTLLQALDPTTVKSIVFKRQNDVKAEIFAAIISNKPQALHALRAYLRVCMPFTIEMEANAVLTTFQRTGKTGNSLIGFTDKPKTADTVPNKQQRPPLGTNADVIALFGVGTAYLPKDVKTVQRKLCVEPTGEVNEDTRSAVGYYRLVNGSPKPDWYVLTQVEADALRGDTVPVCDRKRYMDYYETTILSAGQISLFLKKFNESAPDDIKLPDSVVVSSNPVSKFRKNIIALKNKVPDLAVPAPPDSKLGRVNYEFYQKITGLSKK